MAVFLGVDYGDQHVGLALATGPLSEPLKTVSLSTAIQEIGVLITTHQVTAIVVGLSEGIMAQKTKAFAAQLKDLYRLPVFFQDETLSSYDTRVKVALAGKAKISREQKIDHLVAAAILQDYLDSLDSHPQTP